MPCTGFLKVIPQSVIVYMENKISCFISVTYYVFTTTYTILDGHNPIAGSTDHEIHMMIVSIKVGYLIDLFPASSGLYFL